MMASTANMITIKEEPGLDMVNLTNVDLMHVICKLQEQNRELEAINLEFKKELEKMHNENYCLQEELQKKGKETENNQKELHDLKTKLSAAETNNKKLTEANNIINEHLRNKFLNSDAVDPARAEVEKEIKEEKLKCKEARKKVGELMALLKSEREKFSETETKLNKRVEDLEAAFRTAEKDVEKIISQNRLQVEKYQTDLKSKKKEVEDLECKILVQKITLDKKIEKQNIIISAQSKKLTEETNITQVSQLEKSLREMENFYEKEKLMLTINITKKTQEIKKIKERQDKLIKFAKNVKRKSGFQGRKHFPVHYQLEELESHLFSKVQPVKRKDNSVANMCYEKRARMSVMENPGEFFQEEAVGSFTGQPQSSCCFQKSFQEHQQPFLGRSVTAMHSIRLQHQ